MARLRNHLAAVCGAAGLLGVVGIGAVVAAPAVSASGTPKLYVATTGIDGTNTCRLQSNPCATIAHALVEAPVGAIINVGAGTYTAPLGITQSVSIVGAVNPANNKPKTIVFPATTIADTDSTYENTSPQAEDSLVDVTNGATVNLSNLVVNGSTATRQFDSCANDFVGVYYHNASGTDTNVDIENIVLPPADFGCQDGLGAYVTTDDGSATPSAVTFSGVKVTDYDKNGITCDDLSTSCTVTNSTVTGIGPTNQIAQNGIQMAYDATGSITGSTVSDNTYTGGGADNQATGILIYDEGATTVMGNTLTSNDIDVSASADSGAIAGAWNISNNTASSATGQGNAEGNGYGDGIQIYGVDGNTNALTVSGNTASGSYEDGLSFTGTSDATVSSNTTNSNYDGIYVDSTSSAIDFSDNVSKHNTRYDYEDTSTGGGTSGTADSWTSNSCKPLADSAPEGLC